jgi:hypothetical protein
VRWREVSGAPSHDVLLGDNPNVRQMWIGAEVWQATRKSGLTSAGDAGFAPLFAIGHLWPGTTQASVSPHY